MFGQKRMVIEQQMFSNNLLKKEIDRLNQQITSLKNENKILSVQIDTLTEEYENKIKDLYNTIDNISRKNENDSDLLSKSEEVVYPIWTSLSDSEEEACQNIIKGSDK